MNSDDLTAIIDGRVYIGNLSSALTLDARPELGIDYVLSVCPEHPSRGPNHLCISVADCEYEDLLIHLPDACQFIQSALDQGGRVLVHCVMGVSRSVTVVCAYRESRMQSWLKQAPITSLAFRIMKVMWTRQISASAALSIVQNRRPQVHPNYGFLKQLQVFAECKYAPPYHPAYNAWQRRRKREVRKFFNWMSNSIAIVPDRLLLSDDLPTDDFDAAALLRELGTTHLLTLSPAPTQFPAEGLLIHLHVNIPDSKLKKEGFLSALHDACAFIRAALEGSAGTDETEGKRKQAEMLVHCPSESRACVVVCAYLMSSRNILPSEALVILEDALPLFNPTRNFLAQLQLFHESAHTPPRNDCARDAQLSPRSAGDGDYGSAGASACGDNDSVEKCPGAAFSAPLPLHMVTHDLGELLVKHAARAPFALCALRETIERISIQPADGA